MDGWGEWAIRQNFGKPYIRVRDGRAVPVKQAE